MHKSDTFSRKALYFDLHIKSLAIHYSPNNPKQAYQKIHNFLVDYDFTHEQYSGYHSNHKTTDMQIFRLIRLMKNEFPWLANCTNRFAVTDIGENYNLKNLLNEDPTILS